MYSLVDGGKGMGSMVLTKREFETLDISRYNESDKKEILEIKQNITLTPEYTMDYARGASKNLSEFSSSMLHNVKMRDTPEIEGMIGELLEGLNKVDANTLLEKKKNIFQRWFKTDQVTNFTRQFESVSGVIDEVRDKLEGSVYQLKKDMEHCNVYLEKNRQYIGELDKYIIAGKLRLKEENAELDRESIDLDMSDSLSVHEYNDRKSAADRLERKLFDLSLLREVAVQNIPQIMLIREGDSVLVEKIQSSIESAIPLWEQQMVIAVQLMREKGALEIQKNVVETTNKLILRNSELLKDSSIEIAKELEKGIVDVAVLKKSSENLIATMEGIRAVREDGRNKRLQAELELGKLQTQLNNTLLLSESK